MIERVLQILKENNECVSKGEVQNNYKVIMISKELADKKEEMAILKTNKRLVDYIVHLTISGTELSKRKLENLEKSLRSINTNILSKEEGLYMMFLDNDDLNSKEINLGWFKDRHQFEYCLNLTKKDCDRCDNPRFIKDFYYK